VRNVCQLCKWCDLFVGSVDTLGSIILNDWFPFYRYFPLNDSRPNQAYVEVTRRAHAIWVAAQVQREQGPDSYVVTTSG